MLCMPVKSSDTQSLNILNILNYYINIYKNADRKYYLHIFFDWEEPLQDTTREQLPEQEHL